MAARRIIEVTPSTVYKATCDFADDIPSGGSISTRAVVAISSDGTTVTSTVISSSGGSGTEITFTFSAATDFEDYRVNARATLASGAVLDHTLEFRCRANPIT
jgi:hypothetical protein